jgi:hypothetical protein
MRYFRPLVVCLFLAAWLVLPGCGDDDPTGSPDLCLQNPDSCAAYVDSIRAGTWEMLLNLSSSNPACAELVAEITDGASDTTVICSLDDLFGDDEEFPCDFEVRGRSFSVDCASSDTLYTGETTYCVIGIQISASGSFTDTTIVGSGAVNLTISGNDPQCSLVPDCLVNLSMTGRWLSEEGAGFCPPPTAPTVISRLLGSVRD